MNDSYSTYEKGFQEGKTFIVLKLLYNGFDSNLIQKLLDISDDDIALLEKQVIQLFTDHILKKNKP